MLIKKTKRGFRELCKAAGLIKMILQHHVFLLKAGKKALAWVTKRMH
jgi:hypothetical protein